MSRINGVVIGIVESVGEDEHLGELEVSYPWLSDKNKSQWARVATLMGGLDRGSWFMPEKGDEVLVAFDHGDSQHPYVIGFLWNGQDKPPRTDPKRRVLRSVNGHEIEFYDAPISEGDKGYIRVKDAHGNLVELANARITVTSVSLIELKAPRIEINGRPLTLVSAPI